MGNDKDAIRQVRHRYLLRKLMIASLIFLFIGLGSLGLTYEKTWLCIVGVVGAMAVAIYILATTSPGGHVTLERPGDIDI